MANKSTRIIEYKDYNENELLVCPLCKWKGKAKGNINYFNNLFDVTCPNCDKMILIVSYPLAKG